MIATLLVLLSLFAQVGPLPGAGPIPLIPASGCTRTVIFLTTVSTSPWTNTTGCVLFKIETLSAGGSGGTGSSNYGAGAGGGQYSLVNSTAVSSTNGFSVGAGGLGVSGPNQTGNVGHDTFFCGGTANCTTVASTGVLLGGKGGGGGSSGSGGGGSGSIAGGKNVSAVGGNGGTRNNVTCGGGSGGAGGPHGAGGNAGSGNCAGGTGDGGTVAAGVLGNPPTCFSGTEFDGTHGVGGGGGGPNATTIVSTFCNYGGGSSGANNGAGAASTNGGDGLIIITPLSFNFGDRNETIANDNSPYSFAACA